MFKGQTKSAFTLLELLTVIAILAAILFPVFAQAREIARGMSCLSNMKQLATANLMYAQDYDEFPVPSILCADNSCSAGTVEEKSWPSRLQLYVKNNQIFFCPSWSKEKVNAGDKGNSDYGCTFLGGLTLNPAGPKIRAHYSLYGGASSGVGPTRPAYNTLPNYAYGTFVEVHSNIEVARPSETVMIGEGATYNLASAPGIPAGTFVCAGNKIHQEGGNYAFFDGHAKFGKDLNQESLRARPGAVRLQPLRRDAFLLPSLGKPGCFHTGFENITSNLSENQNSWYSYDECTAIVQFEIHALRWFSMVRRQFLSLLVIATVPHAVMAIPPQQEAIGISSMTLSQSSITTGGVATITSHENAPGSGPSEFNNNTRNSLSLIEGVQTANPRLSSHGQEAISISIRNSTANSKVICGTIVYYLEADGSLGGDAVASCVFGSSFKSVTANSSSGTFDSQTAAGSWDVSQELDPNESFSIDGTCTIFGSVTPGAGGGIE